MRRALWLFLFCLGLAGGATASPTPPTPPPASIYGNGTSLAISPASSAVLLPASTLNYPVVEVINTGTVDAWVAVGNSAIVATNSGIYIQAGHSRSFWLPIGATYLAGITAGGSTTLSIMQWNGAPQYSGGLDTTNAANILAGTLAPARLGDVAPALITPTNGTQGSLGDKVGLALGTLGQAVPAEPSVTAGGYTYSSRIINFGSTFDTYGVVSGYAVNATNSSTAQAAGVTSVMTQGAANAGNGTSAGQFTYVGGNYSTGDGGGLQVYVFNNSTSSGNFVRGIQVGFWGPQPATNGLVFINEIAPDPSDPAGGFAHQLLAVNQSFGQSFDVAFDTDNGSPNVPVHADYWTWLDGSTYFDIAQYESPGFRIGPTAANYNSKVEVDDSASATPTIKAVGSANTAAGGTAATNVTLQLSGAGTGAVKALSPLQLPAFTVSTLPACTAGIANAYAAVSDATSPTYHGALTGGGAVHTAVFCNGSTWVAA